MRLSLVFTLLLIAIFSISSVANAQEPIKTKAELKGTITWSPTADEKSDLLKFPTVYDKFNNAITKIKVTPEQKIKLFMIIQDVDTMKVQDVGTYQDATLRRAGKVSINNVRFENDEKVKITIHPKDSQIDDIDAHMKIFFTIVAPKEKGQYIIKIHSDDVVDKWPSGKEKLPEPMGAKAEKILGSCDDDPVFTEFTLIVTDKDKIEKVDSLVTWSPDPIDPAKKELLTPQFRHRNTYSAIKEVEMKIERKLEVLITVQDFDSISLKNVPGYQDIQLDKEGNLSPKNIQIIEPGKGFKLEVNWRRVKHQGGYYEIPVVIQALEDPGEYKLVVKVDDVITVDSQGKESVYDPTGNNVKADGSKDDNPTEGFLLVKILDDE